MSIILNGLKGADLIIYNILHDDPQASILKISSKTRYTRCTIWRSINYLQSLGFIEREKYSNKKLC
jgi:predicted transcriptional regulator